MLKDVQAALEGAIAEFEKWRQAEQERLRERERFEADWARIQTGVVTPALEELAVLLRNAGWQCSVGGTGDKGVRLMIYQGSNADPSVVRSYMIYELEKQKRYIGPFNN